MAFNQQFDDYSMRAGRGMYGSRNGYTKAPYNPNYEGYGMQRTNNYGRRASNPIKHSGARLKQGKNDKPVITGWKKNRFNFLVFVACPNNGANVLAKGGNRIFNKKGEEYARWTATITDRSAGSVTTHSCLYNTVTKKLYFPDLKMVANPYANQGGYWGNSFVRKRR